ncbi:RING-type E3 ubiquitin transferase [Malassezia cuniculi]|uniref:E3 ubiquitin-protein ligase n=1 Tax=Malassezia cuniculi TaxID=948313 RepID=A0AAF0EX69_9BASI|nr:RING-type E3 ubiquitin transferase [Malassezia cuniculi]
MSGVTAVQELLPRIAHIPVRDDPESYRLTPERAQNVREALCRELFRSVPIEALLPAGVAESVDDALAFVARSGGKISQAQQRGQVVAQLAARKGKQVVRTETLSDDLADIPMAQPEYSTQRRGMTCGHVFRKGEPIFRCHDCSLDDTCVQCVPCYQNSIHAREQHDVVFSVSDEGGGCCDCGDDEAWHTDLGCEFHSLNPCSARDKEPTPQPATGPQTYESALASVPSDLRESFSSFVQRMLAFCLETLEHAREPTQLVVSPDVVDAIKRQDTLETLFEVDSDARMPYAALLWNDEKHSFSQVSEKILEVASATTARGARQFAEDVDRHGRAVLRISSDARLLVRLAQRVTVIDLLVTIIPAFDYYVEEIAGCIIEFLGDLARCSLYINGEPDARLLNVVLASALFAPWTSAELASAPATMAPEFFDPTRLCMLDTLLLLDMRMWKAARLDVRHLLMEVIGSREAKPVVAESFARVYPKLIEAFTLRDREPEHSIYQMTVQLYSVPSIAYRLVQNGFLTVLVHVLRAVFASDMSRKDTTLTLPAPLPPRGQASASSSLLRQQKCYHVFHDVRYMIGAEGVQKTIATDYAQQLDMWLGFFSLFHGAAPDRRAVLAHVEFESELWIQVFHISSHLGRVARIFGESFMHATNDVRRGAFAHAARRILEHTRAHQSCDPQNHTPITMHSVHGLQVIDFNVASQPVSFHHPMHWCLAEILKSSYVLPGSDSSAETLSTIFGDITEPEALELFDFSLRVCVKLAQIRCNVWVRNGFAIRSQAYHYRDSMWMRDIMYDQDLFLLQCAAAFLPHDLFIATVLDRFDLVEWFSGHSEEHADYDDEQTTFLAEEALFLLIKLLNEVSVPAHWPIEQQVRHELIHYLALGPGTYSEVTKQIPERLTDHACFDRELANVASFRSPDGTSDYGIYELRPEYYAEVQPFFHHYTRNQRERAHEVLNEKRAKSAAGVPPITLAPHAQLHVLRDTPFCRLESLLVSTDLLRMLFYALVNAAFYYKDVPDTLVDTALHLLITAFTESKTEIAAQLVRHAFELQRTRTTLAVQTTMLELLLELETAERFAPFKPRITYIVQAAAENNSTAAAQVERTRTARDQGTKRAAADATSAADAKRAAARARQNAIMQQFSAQQKSLMESLGDEDLSDEDDERAAMSTDDVAEKPDFGTCIVCQEQLDSSSAFGSLGHLQPSRFLRTSTPRQPASTNDVLGVPLNLDRGDGKGARVRGKPYPYDSAAARLNEVRRATLGGALTGFDDPPTYGFAPEQHKNGIVAITCNHRMHVSCFNTYAISTEQRHAIQVARNHPEDLSRFEFVCPLCKSLGNVLLPVPGASQLSAPLPGSSAPGSTEFNTQPLSEWVRKINIAILKKTPVGGTPQKAYQEWEHGLGTFLAMYANPDAQPHNPDLGVGVFSADEYQMLQRIANVLQLIAHETGVARAGDFARTILSPSGWLPPEEVPHNEAPLYIPKDAVAYTLAQLEIVQRGVQRPPGPTNSVADALTEQQITLVRSLLGSLSALVRATVPSIEAVDDMRSGLLKRLLPHWANESSVRAPLVIRDPLGILVETAVLMPEHLPQMTTLMYYLGLVRVIFGLAQPTLVHAERRRAEDTCAEDLAIAAKIFPQARWLVTSIVSLVGYVRGNITLGFDHLDDAHLAKVLCSYTLPFLRRAAMLHRVVAAKFVAPEADSEYNSLLQAMNIPPPAEALSVHTEQAGLIATLVEGWAKHAYALLAPLFRPLPIITGNSDGSERPGGVQIPPVPSIVLEHPHIYELLPLPTDLAILLQQTQHRVCERCKTLPPTHSLCLFCGDILCEQSYCCSDPEDEESRGECNQHTDICGGRIGMHFRLSSNVVVLLFQGNGCFTSSPYLNSHGEVDRFLLKARPQHLHLQRYDELRKQWLQHGICNLVTRRIESTIDPGGWITF